MLYNNFAFEQNESGITFGSGNFTLEFSPDGQLASVGFGGKSFTLDKPEISLTVGGEYRSTLDVVNINKNWAALKLFDAETIAPESEYLSHKIVKTHDSIELRLKVRVGQFEITKIYRVNASRHGFVRRLEITNIGENAKLRSVTLAFPKLDGFSPAIKAAAPTLLTNEESTFAAWFDPRVEKTSLDGSLNCTIQVQNPLDNGESVETNEIIYEYFETDAISAAKIVSSRLESAGLRLHREKEATMRSLVIYEVEIGSLRLSETKCHHRYDHPEELAADLERIKSLGFNTIELMPSFLFPCYTVYDLKNPDIQHGAGESIRPIIRRAHEVGMKIILDILMHGCIDTEIADFDREHYCSRRYY